MKTSLISKKSVAISAVLLLAATIVPSSASATTTEEPEDNVVTVLIDLGEDDGSDEEFCEGSSVLNIPDEAPISASLNTKIPGIANPTLGDIISYWFPYQGAGVRIDTMLEFVNQGVVSPSGADLETIQSIAYETQILDGYDDVPIDGGLTESVARYRTQYSMYDLTEDGIIDASDSPGFLSETRRAYTTDWFEVSFDADDCEVNSAFVERVAILEVGRGELMHSTNGGSTWNVAEIPDDLDRELLSSEVVSMGTSRLRLKTNLVGGLISLPLSVAWEPAAYMEDGNLVFDSEGYGMWPVAFGDEASIEMKAIVEIMGTAKPTGMYRNSYYYQLTVLDDQYIGEELLYILGCNLGAYYCGP